MKRAQSDQLRKKDEEIQQLLMQLGQLTTTTQPTLKTTSGKGKNKLTSKNDVGKEPSNDEEKDV